MAETDSTNVENKERTERIVMTNWALLSEWYCVNTDVTEDEMAGFIKDDHFKENIVTKDQVKQRLFGGFNCPIGRVHVYHATGAYTYLGPNWDMPQSQRNENWQELLRENDDQPFDRQAIFASDAPEVATAEKKVGVLVDALLDDEKGDLDASK